MNIAILIPELGGGGAERVAQIIGDYFCDSGEKVYYFLMKTSINQVYPVKGKIVNTGIKSSVANNSRGNISVLGKLLLASLKMRKWKWKYQIDVAISFMEECNYINVLSKGKEKVITRVCTILSQRDDLKGALYKKKLVHFLYGLSNKVIVMSDYAREDMHKCYGISYRKLQKIPNPAVRNNQGVAEDGWIYGDKVVVCVGRLEHVKQQESIIRAFSYVISDQKDAKLLILGTGPKRKYLENLCEKYKLGQSVIFVGFTNNVDYFLRNSKVFVMASKVEGFPNSMVEAMAQGLPVVTTNCPGACGEIVGSIKESGDGGAIQYCKYGVLTPDIPGNVKTGNELLKEEILLGKAILNLLTDIKLHERYSERSLKRASMFDLDKVMAKWYLLVKNK